MLATVFEILGCLKNVEILELDHDTVIFCRISNVAES
jgi:hypothetical protein